MIDETQSEATGLAGIFLSHAHEDRPFVRRLAKDLLSAGVKVWVDETDLSVGDPLEERIMDAISDMDYVGVVISRNSDRSDWVRREVELALGREVAGRRVKVLPILLRGGTIPLVLSGKLFADFTSDLTYQSSLRLILRRLGAAEAPVDSIDRISELASTSALLQGALRELRLDGISNATADALLSSTVDDFDLSEFFSLAVREFSGQTLFGLALTILPCIDRRSVGHEALDYCLLPGQLEDWQTTSIAIHMQYVESRAAVLWCHSRLTGVLRSDVYYHSFLNRHVDVLLDDCLDEMTAYLLQPDRGPGDYNVNSFEILIAHAQETLPFKRRWQEWIVNGYFDRQRRPGSESAWQLYLALNRHVDDDRFDDVIESVHAYVDLLMRSRAPERFRDGLYHLVAMIDASYQGSGRVLTETLTRVYDVPFEWQEIFDLLSSGLEAVGEYNDNRNSENAERVQKWYHRIYTVDRTGITGYFPVANTE